MQSLIYLNPGYYMHNIKEGNNIGYIIHVVVHRKELLIHADNHNPTLQMLLKLFDLLASCSEGDDLYIDLTCQNVMGISELLQVMFNLNK